MRKTMTSRVALTAGAILVGGLVGLAEASVVQTDMIAPDQSGLTGAIAETAVGSFAIASREDDGRGRGRGRGADDGPDHDAGDDHGGRGRGADDGPDHDAGDDHGGHGDDGPGDDD